MLIHIKNIIIILIIILLLDIPVIGYLNRNLYLNQFRQINQKDLKLDGLMLFYAILSYLLLSIALYIFIIYPYLLSIKSKYKKNNLNILLNSFILGLVIYGVYNFTNKATLYKYNNKTAIIDSLWGSILFTLTTFIIINITNIFEI